MRGLQRKQWSPIESLPFIAVFAYFSLLSIYTEVCQPWIYTCHAACKFLSWSNDHTHPQMLELGPNSTAIVWGSSQRHSKYAHTEKIQVPKLIPIQAVRHRLKPDNPTESPIQSPEPHLWFGRLYWRFCGVISQIVSEILTRKFTRSLLSVSEYCRFCIYLFYRRQYEVFCVLCISSFWYLQKSKCWNKVNIILLLYKNSICDCT
jgi:hypothetical protein